MKDVAAYIAGKGCRQPAYITADISISPSKERYEGFVEGLEENGISFNKRMHYAGTFSVENGNLVSGSLTSDLNTLTTDPAAVDPKLSEGKTSADLDAHLKSADFFDTAKYPSVKFDITKVEDLAAGTESKVAGANKTVSGNLTIKDKTVNVSFPAKVEVTENGLTMVSNFTINRQDWGLAYGTEGDPKDWMISQEVHLELNVVAGK